MKKKITAVILTISMCVSMSGCSDDGTGADQVEYGYFIELESNGDMTIVYDRETRVKYYIYDYEHGVGENSRHCFGITPIYNADGSLQLYEGDEKK